VFLFIFKNSFLVRFNRILWRSWLA